MDTIEYDSAMRAVQAEARELAVGLRGLALDVDAAPAIAAARVDATLLDSPTLRMVRHHNPAPLNHFLHALALVELAKGDAATLLACPGPALAGTIVRILGDEAQNDRLVRAFDESHAHARGYLAITEPDAGSDVTRLQSELRPDDGDGYLLHGAKRYVGNGHRGTAGVVLARTGPGPLALRAALVFGRDPGLRTEALDMTGLRGAQISAMTFDGVPVRREDLLGEHLSPLRRGMWAIQLAFNTVRVQVATMAAGTALAVHGYVLAERHTWPVAQRFALDAAGAEAEAIRLVVLDAARALDHDLAGSAYQASTAKLVAVRHALKLSNQLPRLLGQGALMEHPLLEKWRRDCAAFEFMEGTSHVQSLHVAQGRRKAVRSKAGAGIGAGLGPS